MTVVVPVPQYDERAYLVTLEDLLRALGIDAPDDATVKVSNYDRMYYHKPRDFGIMAQPGIPCAEPPCRMIITVRTPA